MLKLPHDMLKEIEGRFQTHKVNIAACNIFFQTIRMLNGRHEIVDRSTYEENFRNALSDIELVTPPTDVFIPSGGENGKLFVVNQLAAEYLEITKRLPMTLLEESFSPTNALIILLKNDPKKLDVFYDDIFIYFCMYKYLDQIDMIRLNTISNFTPMIEYIVNNITLNDWKSYLVSRRINQEKYAEKCEDLIFNPDISATQKFYTSPKNENTPKIDVVNLIMRLTSNTVVKTDMYFVLGVYLILSFAMADFNNEKAEESPCAKYVREVLSKL